jgi:hypothetical protein
MSDDNLWRLWQALPSDEQQVVRDFVESLNERRRRSQRPHTAKGPSFTDGPFFGMWRDRPEMKDSERWVRELRESEFRR